MRKGETGGVQLSGAAVIALGAVLAVGAAAVGAALYWGPKPSRQKDESKGLRILKSIPADSDSEAFQTPSPADQSTPASDAPPTAPDGSASIPSSVPESGSGSGGAGRTPTTKRVGRGRAPEVVANPAETAVSDTTPAEKSCALRILAAGTPAGEKIRVLDPRVSELAVQIRCSRPFSRGIVEWTQGENQSELLPVALIKAGEVTSPYGNHKPTTGAYAVRLLVGGQPIGSATLEITP